MLDLALDFFRTELGSFIAARTGSDKVEVKLTQLVDEQGKYAFQKDSLGLTLINLEEERVFRAQLPTHAYTAGQHVVQEPEVKLNLFMLIAAHFQRYDEALKHLSHVLLYFQGHPTFTADNHPALDPRIERLTVELQSPNYEQLNQIWAFIGGKQLPSVIYKVRLVALQDLEVSAIQPPVMSVTTVTVAR